MPRKVQQRQPKRAVYVFWEGESEEAYVKSLKRLFSKQASIRAHREKGTFDTARAYYNGNRDFRSAFSEYDEIWFFFDSEVDKADQWDKNMKCLKDMIESRKKNPIKIRLLMSMGCVEYWFLLHYERTRPAIASPADKERVLKDLRKYIPLYEKGSQKAIDKIAENYPCAVENGRWTLECLSRDGMPEEEKKRDQWLFQGKHTFTTVHEALEMLMNL